MGTRRGPGGGDDGQVVTALVVLAFAMILAVVVVGLAPLGQATDESSQAANAADAAALAGANEVRDLLLADVGQLRFEDLDVFLRGSTGCSATGRAAAEDYAQRNGAAVTSYCYRPIRDRIEVEVRMRATGLPSGGPARGDAVAALGMNFAGCTRHDDPVPTTTTTTATTLVDAAPILPPLPPLPELPLGTTLRCGPLRLRFDVVPVTGELQLVPPERLAQVLTPRLIE